MSVLRVLMLSLVLAMPNKAVASNDAAALILGSIFAAEVRQSLTTAIVIHHQWVPNSPGQAAPVRRIFGEDVLLFFRSGRYYAVSAHRAADFQRVGETARRNAGIPAGQEMSNAQRYSHAWHNALESAVRPLGLRSGTWEVRGPFLCFDNLPCWQIVQAIDWRRRGGGGVIVEVDGIRHRLSFPVMAF